MDAQVVNMMDDDGNTNGFVDFEEFASFWLGDEWWLANEEVDSPRHPVAKPITGLGAQCGKLGRALLRKKNESLAMSKKERQVEPESVFVMSADAAASLDRERAELMDKIQQIHENEFHQLEDALNTHAESRMEADFWETRARESFSEEATLAKLGWQKDLSEAAKRALIATIGEETNTNITSDEGLGRTMVVRTYWRCFLKEELAHMATGGQALHRQSTWDAAPGGVSVGNKAQVTEAARAFVKASQGELEVVLDNEVLPLGTGIEALIASLTEEVRSRDKRIQSLVSRQSKLADATPRKITVSGLQGDAAAANGTYCADGLRACWGRPVYLQQLDGSTDRQAFFLFYDQAYVKDDATGVSQWADGTWIIGPSQNSDRCTAYMPEVVHDGAVETLLHPCCNVWAHCECLQPSRFQPLLLCSRQPLTMKSI
eukprot:COSAG02_NODE_5044_length_4700_cov_1.930015_2_plen_431_part_00